MAGGRCDWLQHHFSSVLSLSTVNFLSFITAGWALLGSPGFTFATYSSCSPICSGSHSLSTYSIIVFFFFLFFSLFIQLRVLHSLWLTPMRKSMKEIGVMNSGWSCVCGEWLSPNSAFVFSWSDTASLFHCCIYLCKRKSSLLWLIPCNSLQVHGHKAFYSGYRHLFAHLCFQASHEN